MSYCLITFNPSCYPDTKCINMSDSSDNDFSSRNNRKKRDPSKNNDPPKKKNILARFFSDESSEEETKRNGKEKDTGTAMNKVDQHQAQAFDKSDGGEPDIKKSLVTPSTDNGAVAFDDDLNRTIALSLLHAANDVYDGVKGEEEEDKKEKEGKEKGEMEMEMEIIDISDGDDDGNDIIIPTKDHELVAQNKMAHTVDENEHDYVVYEAHDIPFHNVGCTRLPTKCFCELSWLYTCSRGNSVPGKYGKWLLFADVTKVDEKWTRVVELQEQGLLGHQAKVFNTFDYNL